jgi:hypothetical protein
MALRVRLSVAIAPASPAQIPLKGRPAREVADSRAVLYRGADVRSNGAVSPPGPAQGNDEHSLFTQFR